jgi:predicted O-methyltransferase YrrM
MINFLEYKIARINELIKEPRCRDACPDDQTNRVEGLIHLISDCSAQNVLEIGSHRGISTETFLLLCRSVIAVDPLQETTHLSASEFVMRCGGYPNLQLLKGWSPDILKDIPPEKFDLVYLDAEHDLEAVRRDIVAGYPLVKPGGYLAGHDHSEYTQVPKAVDEFIAQYGGEVKLYRDSSWAVRKADK